ncbi:MAG: fatty acid desaturase [Alphaproteobacteria bacterium]|nr:fatty acid desaturase [Alphaproteobacteria bacterium]
MPQEMLLDPAAGAEPLAPPLAGARDPEAVLADLFERRGRALVEPHVIDPAWPTVALFASVLAALAVSVALGLAGVLPGLAVFALNAVLIHLIFTPLHEAVHRNIGGRRRGLRWLNELVGHVSGYVLMAPLHSFRRPHLRHHQFTNHPQEDPSYWMRGDSLLAVLPRALVIQPVMVSHLWRLARTPAVRRELRMAMLCFLSYGVLLVLALAQGWAGELLLYWYGPAWVAVVACALLFDWPVHHPHTDRSRYRSTGILRFPPRFQRLADIVWSGHTYHLIHHLWPKLPFYRYGTIHAALASDLRAVDARIEPMGGARAD